MFPFPQFLTQNITATLGLTNKSVNDFVFSPDTASCGFRFNVNGDAQVNDSGAGYSTPNSNQWMDDDFAALPEFDASKYECGFFSVTGSTSLLSGTVDTYLTLTATRTWTLSDYYSGFGLDSVTGTIRVREIANPSNIATATLTLTITAEP